MTTPFTDASRRTLKKKLYSKPSAGLPKLAQELIEQLSVISFCRLKITETFAGDPRKPTKDLESLEDAVQELARLIKEITEAVSNPNFSRIPVVLPNKSAKNPLRIIK